MPFVMTRAIQRFTPLRSTFCFTALIAMINSGSPIAV
jgi:hypothetical protein